MPRRYLVRHPSSPVARWARRILGIAGTAAVLAVGIQIGSMLLPDDRDEVVAPARVAGPATKARAEKAERRRRVAAREREERRRAAEQVRSQGYAPVKLADYFGQHALRVLIGKPVGSTPPGLRAFFFVRGDYIGQDATSPSLKLRPGRQLDREITLVYTLYEPGNPECCPSGGDTRVHFRWTGEALEPREPIPPDYLRMPIG